MCVCVCVRVCVCVCVCVLFILLDYTSTSSQPHVLLSTTVRLVLSSVIRSGWYLCLAAAERYGGGKVGVGGKVRSECLTCTFRASCCSAGLSRAQILAFAGPSVQVRGWGWGQRASEINKYFV